MYLPGNLSMGLDYRVICNVFADYYLPVSLHVVAFHGEFVYIWSAVQTIWAGGDRAPGGF